MGNKESPFSTIKNRVVTLEKLLPIPNTANLISDFTVIDARPDSTSLGFYKTGSNRIFSIVLQTNTVSEVSSFLRDYLGVKENVSGIGVKVLMVIRKLWLSNAADQDPVAINPKNPGDAWLRGVLAKFEFYVNTGDGYFPLYRFDTLYTGHEKIDAKNSYLPGVLAMSVQRLANKPMNDMIVNRKKMSLEDIDAYNKHQMQVPILQNGAYKKGVYKTFNEFKMNAPSFTDYEIQKDKYTSTIFVKGANGDYPVRDNWGYSDGEHLYVHSADTYFELIRRQNTFVCNGAKALSRYRIVNAGNAIALGILGGGVGRQNKKVVYLLNLRPFELDMDTGEIF